MVEIDCPQCGEPLFIDDEAGMAGECHACGAVIPVPLFARAAQSSVTTPFSSVDIADPPQEDHTFQQPPEPMYYYSIRRQRLGPVAQSELSRMIASRQLSPDAFVWTQGMKTWVRASSVQALAVNALADSASPPSLESLGMAVTPTYAGFWKRLAALIIDQLLLSTVGFTLGVLFGVIIGGIMGARGADAESIAVVMTIVGYVIGVILDWLYHTVLESSAKQGSLGKMALGIAVTDMSGQRISFARANGRYWAKILSLFCFFIGYIMAAFTQKKQGLHDILSGCLVINKPK